jgi:NnrU protein
VAAEIALPQAIGVVLWAAGHLLANGDGKSLIFFGGLAVSAVVQAALMARNGNNVSPDVRKGHNFLSLMAGLALYGLMTQLHYAVTGMPLMELQ